jgi:hypothetical protein
MIVIVKLSARRYIAVETQKYESAWTSGMRCPEGYGLITAGGTIIAGPGPHLDVMLAAQEYAGRECPDKIIAYEMWKDIENERHARIKELNKGLGLGAAVLTRKRGDDQL